MNGKKLLLQKLMLLLLLLVVVAAGAAVSFGMKNKSAKDDGNAASKGRRPVLPEQLPGR